MNFFFVKQLTK